MAKVIRIKKDGKKEVISDRLDLIKQQTETIKTSHKQTKGLRVRCCVCGRETSRDYFDSEPGSYVCQMCTRGFISTPDSHYNPKKKCESTDALFDKID